MDDASAKQEDTTVARTQEEFEQWKRAQHARNRKEETAPEAPAKPTPKPAPQPTPLSEQPNIFGPGFFDKWKEDENQARLQLPVMGVKKSKFADIWESETSKEMAPPKSAPEPSTDDEDKRGFDRILAMLGNANINRVDTAPPEQPSSTAQTKTKSRYSGFFEQQQDERRPASGPIPSYRGPDVNLQHIIHQKPMADPNEGKKQSNYLLELMMGSSKQPQPQPQQTLTQQQPQPQPHPQPQPQPPQQLGHPPQQPIPHPPQPQQPFPHWMEPPLPMGTRSVPEQMIDDHHRNHAGPFGNLMPLPPQMGGMPLMGPPGPGRGFMPPPGFTRAMPPVPPGMPYHPSLGPPTREPLHYPTPAGGGAPRMPPGFFNAPQHVMDGAGARYETR
ncbi:hypothetical protein K470DRAFT_102958 [Piedraia hortae CBS 480.64]|uniref:Uncharacterized protein n=1 Tax=Piedraia hortae CBS 480.64 TaxID=1314780 RepID=A0A6A7BVQ4_9PEZI|nr:hypothetical protein K470DRAFT_102958 [Piedraia hortae CBS 480.64]